MTDASSTGATPRDDGNDADARGASLCRACAREGHTCCQNHDIFVTWGDCRRIQAHTRQNDFFEYRGCADVAYADQTDDPLWRCHVFRSDGSRRVLKRCSDGNCIFLTASGCDLPLRVRPLVCRLFPHTYSARGIDAGWDPECPAAGRMPGAVVETGIAGIAPVEALQWHQLLYCELIGEGQDDEDWTHV